MKSLTNYMKLLEKTIKMKNLNIRNTHTVKKNTFFNALQVKFSYAITCHKSQGGQWKTIFIEQPYLPEGPSKEYLRWLYTAITRAQEKLYLIGFKEECFEND